MYNNVVISPLWSHSRPQDSFRSKSSSYFVLFAITTSALWGHPPSVSSVKLAFGAGVRGHSQTTLKCFWLFLTTYPPPPPPPPPPPYDDIFCLIKVDKKSTFLEMRDLGVKNFHVVVVSFFDEVSRQLHLQFGPCFVFSRGGINAMAGYRACVRNLDQRVQSFL